MKMTLAEFKSLWPSNYGHYVIDGPYDPFKAKTQKGALHKVNPVWMPGKTRAPSLYRRLHLGRKVKNERR